MLMALTTVTRSSELNKLDPQLMTDKGDQIVFHIGNKTTKQTTLISDVT